MISSGSLIFLLFFVFGSSYGSVNPECFQLKAEFYHLRIVSESNVTTLADGDELYDPDCQPNGLFKAKQCNASDVCWCVDGVRRSDSGDRNLHCVELILPNWVRIEMKHKETSTPLDVSQVQWATAAAIQEHYSVKLNLDSETVKYDADARLISIEMKVNPNDQTVAQSLSAYHVEKDIVMQSVFGDHLKFNPRIEGEILEIENIMVYYVDEKEPTNSMTISTPGLLTVTGVAILAACLGILALLLIRKQKRGQYEKAQTSEMEEI